MNVRKTSATTFSLIVLTVGVSLLIPVIQNTLPYDIRIMLDRRFDQAHYIGGYHLFMIYTSIWLIILVGIIDAIFKNRIAFALFASLNIPIVLSIPIIIALFVPVVNFHLFWGLLYISAALGVYWTFKKFVTNMHPGGQPLFLFIKGINKIVKTGKGHLADRYIVFCIAVFLAGYYILMLISIVAYVIANWGLYA